MVQFKNVLTGAETRPYRRAVTAQKCVRAGGKHNDLENVGYTARHNTFFEMLGNFSFGDYFKERAIELAWMLVTVEFGLAKRRLWVTTHPDDEEAMTLWRKISGLPASRIIGHHENLWAMGPTGRAAFVRRSSTTRARRSPVASRAVRTRTATATSSSGTWCSCSSIRSTP